MFFYKGELNNVVGMVRYYLNKSSECEMERNCKNICYRVIRICLIIKWKSEFYIYIVVYMWGLVYLYIWWNRVYVNYVFCMYRNRFLWEDVLACLFLSVISDNNNMIYWIFYFSIIKLLYFLRIFKYYAGEVMFLLWKFVVY